MPLKPKYIALKGRQSFEVSAVPGVGPRTEERLSAAGIEEAAALAAASEEEVAAVLEIRPGKRVKALIEAARREVED